MKKNILSHSLQGKGNVSIFIEIFGINSNQNVYLILKLLEISAIEAFRETRDVCMGENDI